MKLFSESPEKNQNYWLSPWKNLQKVVNFCGDTVFENSILWVESSTDWLVLLNERTTLYTYSLTEIDAFRKAIGARTLGVICEWLFTPRGSGVRRWVNAQEGKSNFNTNIFLQLDQIVLSPSRIFALQQKISVAIAQTLKLYAKNGEVSIHFPFHYLLDWGKVAGHLIQSHITDSGTVLRIGIGINSNFAPELPQNDELAKYIYGSPSFLHLNTRDWIDLYENLRKNILEQLPMENSHELYKDLLSQKSGDTVRIFEDKGSIRIWKPVCYGVISDITEDGRLLMEDGRLYGTEYHVVAG